MTPQRIVAQHIVPDTPNIIFSSHQYPIGYWQSEHWSHCIALVTCAHIAMMNRRPYDLLIFSFAGLDSASLFLSPIVPFAVICSVFLLCSFCFVVFVLRMILVADQHWRLIIKCIGDRYHCRFNALKACSPSLRPGF